MLTDRLVLLLLQRDLAEARRESQLAEKELETRVQAFEVAAKEAEDIARRVREEVEILRDKLEESEGDRRRLKSDLRALVRNVD